MSRDVVFTIQVGRTISPETWAMFLDRVLAAGRTPRDVISRIHRTVRCGRDIMTTTTTIRAALYARVSTVDQTCENQLLDLRRYCASRGWTAIQNVDTGVSGRTPVTADQRARPRTRRGTISSRGCEETGSAGIARVSRTGTAVSKTSESILADCTGNDRVEPTSIGVPKSRVFGTVQSFGRHEALQFLVEVLHNDQRGYRG